MELYCCGAHRDGGIGGIDGNVGTNLMIVGFQALGTDLASAAFLARIPANLVDKGIACVIAWIILRKLPANMQSLSGGKRRKRRKRKRAAAPKAE